MDTHTLKNVSLLPQLGSTGAVFSTPFRNHVCQLYSMQQLCLANVKTTILFIQNKLLFRIFFWLQVIWMSDPVLRVKVMNLYQQQNSQFAFTLLNFVAIFAINSTKSKYLQGRRNSAANPKAEFFHVRSCELQKLSPCCGQIETELITLVSVKKKQF